MHSSPPLSASSTTSAVANSPTLLEPSPGRCARLFSRLTSDSVTVLASRTYSLAGSQATAGGGCALSAVERPACRLMHHKNLHLECGTSAGLGQQLRAQLAISPPTKRIDRSEGGGDGSRDERREQQVGGWAGRVVSPTCSSTLSCSAMCCVHARCIVSAELTISCTGPTDRTIRSRAYHYLGRPKHKGGAGSAEEWSKSRAWQGR